MIEALKEHWEGQVIDGSFPLLKHLGDGRQSAVFLTEYDGRPAAIKLFNVDTDGASGLLRHLQQSARLSHPNLIQLFRAGRVRQDDSLLVFAVMEYADDDLSRVVPDRPLTDGEVRDMMNPLLSALRYLHENGFVHSRLKPANIMAAGEQLKISNDGILRIGDLRRASNQPSDYDAPETTLTAASDVWSLGVTVAEVLTQKLPSWTDAGEPVFHRKLPSPFHTIVTRCLQRDPANRPSLNDIAADLRGEKPKPAPAPIAPPPAEPVRTPAASRRNMVLLSAGAVALAGVLIGPRLIDRSPSAVAPPPASAPAPQKSDPPPATPAPKPAPPAVSPGQVVNRVLPDVPRRTQGRISGTVRVTILASVDASGSVTNAKIESRGPSRYFADLALKSARRWEFKPPTVDGRNVASQWNLKYEFTRKGTNVVPTRLRW